MKTEPPVDDQYIIPFRSCLYTCVYTIFILLFFLSLYTVYERRFNQNSFYHDEYRRTVLKEVKNIKKIKIGTPKTEAKKRLVRQVGIISTQNFAIYPDKEPRYSYFHKYLDERRISGEVMFIDKSNIYIYVYLDKDKKVESICYFSPNYREADCIDENYSEEDTLYARNKMPKGNFENELSLLFFITFLIFNPWGIALIDDSKTKDKSILPKKHGGESKLFYKMSGLSILLSKVEKKVDSASEVVDVYLKKVKLLGYSFALFPFIFVFIGIIDAYV